jgi:hypothetical protein
VLEYLLSKCEAAVVLEKRMGIEKEREQDGVGGLGEQGQCREHTQSWVLAPNIRKNAAHKESSQENLTSKSRV